MRAVDAVTAVGLGSAATAAGLGEAAFGAAGAELTAFGLGSCIGLILWSPRLRLGTLCHIVLPDSAGALPGAAEPAKYADWAVPWAVRTLVSRGCRPGELQAKLAGGAQVLALPIATEIGRQNERATRQLLDTHRIPVTASCTGGHTGRTVRFYPATGVMSVRPVGGPEIKL